MYCRSVVLKGSEKALLFGLSQPFTEALSELVAFYIRHIHLFEVIHTR